MLRAMRSDVAWIAAGIQAGAFEAALRYVTGRTQFGRPLGSFQLVQEKLARMGEDALDEGEQTPRRLEQVASAVAILDIGRMDGDAQEKTERVDEDMALAARDLLARIIALR